MKGANTKSSNPANPCFWNFLLMWRTQPTMQAIEQCTSSSNAYQGNAKCILIFHYPIHPICITRNEAPNRHKHCYWLRDPHLLANDGAQSVQTVQTAIRDSQSALSQQVWQTWENKTELPNTSRSTTKYVTKEHTSSALCCPQILRFQVQNSARVAERMHKGHLT